MDNINKPVDFRDGRLYLLDQRKLPHEEIFVEISNYRETHDGIKDMVVRGAPCIGFTAIYGMALGLKHMTEPKLEEVIEIGHYLISARPTAVNLKFEVDKCIEKVKILIKEQKSSEECYRELVHLGDQELLLSEKRNRSMAKFAENELDTNLTKESYKILTHCNTGFLACGSVGTALGVIQHLGEQNKINSVWVDETRPYLQGSRLTAYELTKLDIDHQIVVEGAASYLMENGLVDAIFTGADRIVANGDTANKVGTSNLAIIAKHFGVPFYIVAPASTFDLGTETGKEIEIELRDENEILSYKNLPIAPTTSKAFNPSFDITSGSLITGIISEFGVAKGDYQNSLKDIIS